MIKLLKFINERENNRYEKVKITSVVYNEEKSNLLIKLEYACNSFLLEDKNIFKKHIQSYFDYLDGVKIEIKAKKYYLDSEILKSLLYKFLKDNFKAITSIVSKENIRVEEVEEKYLCDISCNPSQYFYLQNEQFATKATIYFSKILFNNIDINLKVKEEKDLNEDNILKKQLQKFTLNTFGVYEELSYIEIRNIKNIVGEIEVDTVLPLSALREDGDCIVAGTIKFFTMAKTKAKKKENGEESKRRDYFSFQLEDGFGKLSCFIFPRKELVETLSNLEDGKKVVISGKLEVLEGGNRMRVKNIAECEILIPETEKEEIKVREVPAEYTIVKPELYIMEVQSNLFEVEKPVHKFLSENEIVVFDLETTGVEPLVDEIIEIGAAKLVNGKISEVFNTFIKPNRSIPEIITKITGIDDNMVKNAPDINMVIPDFYKFCHNCVLVAYNIDFDYRFLERFAKKTGYEFNNKRIDALRMARIGLPSLRHHKLKQVVQALDIKLENAHRALNDTIATADVFTRLIDFVDNA